MSQLTAENKDKHLFILPTNPISSEWVFEFDDKDNVSVNIIDDVGNADDPVCNKLFHFSRKDLVEFHNKLGKFITQN